MEQGLDTDVEKTPRARAENICKEVGVLLEPHKPLEAEDTGTCGAYWTRVRRVLGDRFLVIIVVVQHVQRGFVGAVLGQAAPFIMKTHRVNAAQMQVMGIITSAPWVLKPLIGMVSDLVPIFGLNKAPYMVLTAALSTVALLCLGLMPSGSLSLLGIVAFFTMISLHQSTSDILTEAKYSEKIREHPAEGPDIVTFVWVGIQVMSLLATIGMGPVIQFFGPRIAIACMAVPSVAMILPLCLGFLQEKLMSKAEVVTARSKYFQQSEVCFLVMVMFSSTLIMLAITGMYADAYLLRWIISLMAGAAVLFSFSLVLSPIIARANAFSMIQGACTVQISGACFYFYTDDEVQYPEGPHFSPFFYVSVMNTLGSVFSLLGIYMYQTRMKNWTYRQLMVITNICLTTLAVFEIVLFARVNQRLGIPDHALAFGLSVLGPTIYQWQWMPQVGLMSYLCPKGMEATLFALLAGSSNLGAMISANNGALLLNYFGVTPRGNDWESDQFQNLWKVTSIAAAAPLLATVLCYKLLPNARQDEKLLRDDEVSCTRGSLLRIWSKES